MPGNDLTSLRDIVPVAADQQATARANITTILNGILNDIEPKVTPAGLDMSSALSFLSGGVYSPITNLGYLNLQDRAATPAVNESLYVTANELYFRDGNGNDFAMTSGGSVNAGAGSITGSGYGSPVEVNWNTATAEYRMKSAAGTHDLADVVMDRAQFSDGSSYFATLGATAGMAATLAYSLPVAFPSSTSVMTMTNAGGMSHTRDISVDNVTVTGEFKHPTVYKQVQFANGIISGANVSILAAKGGSPYAFCRFGATATNANYLLIPIEVEEGQTIDEVVVKSFKLATDSERLSIQLFRETHTSGSTPVLDGVDVLTALSSTASGTITTTLGPAHDVVANSNYYIAISVNLGSTSEIDVAQVKIGVSRS